MLRFKDLEKTNNFALHLLDYFRQSLFQHWAQRGTCNQSEVGKWIEKPPGKETIQVDLFSIQKYLVCDLFQYQVPFDSLLTIGNWKNY